MPNFVIQVHPGEYHDFVGYLADLRFQPIVLHAPAWRFKTPGKLLWQYVYGTCQLLWHLPEIRAARTIVVFSHFAFAVKLLSRLGLLRYRTLYCFGFFLHEQRWLRLFRWLVKLDRAHDHYVIFSQTEVELYESELGIGRERLHFVPLGDWAEGRQMAALERTTEIGDYYFAGGRSNRDYLPLIEAFRSLPARLLIVCSESNLEELNGIELPPNVEIFSDLPASEFELYLRSCRAGIIPLKNDLGSSGQSVALALMRAAKCMIATDVAGVRDYVKDGVSGFLVQNLAAQLPTLIGELEGDLAQVEAMGRAARALYEQRFSKNIAASAFEQVLFADPGGAAA
jgi:glycosyltransferase involved in cell wall biosynthesis